MKKLALLIAISSVAVAALASNRMRIVRGYNLCANEPSLVEPIQKPRGDQVTQEFHQTYPLTGNGRVSIANVNGDVQISAWDRNEVKVDAVKRASNQQRLDDVTVDVTNTADSVIIKTRYERDRNWDNGGYASVEYTVTIPRGARLDGAELVNGSLDIEGVQGDVHASSVNGQLKAAGLGGEVKLSTVNGGVEANVASLDDAKGVTISSVNGSLV